MRGQTSYLQNITYPLEKIFVEINHAYNKGDPPTKTKTIVSHVGTTIIANADENKYNNNKEEDDDKHKHNNRKQNKNTK